MLEEKKKRQCPDLFRVKGEREKPMMAMRGKERPEKERGAGFSAVVEPVEEKRRTCEEKKKP